jgi:hypothetical protein
MFDCVEDWAKLKLQEDTKKHKKLRSVKPALLFTV